MRFNDCILSAVAQGALDNSEGQKLIAQYGRHVLSYGGTLDPRGAEGLAKDALAKELADTAARKQHLAELSAAKSDEIVARLEAYRNAKGKPDVVDGVMSLLDNRNNLLGGGSSVTTLHEALIGYAHGKLEQMLWDFRRKWTSGARRETITQNHLVDAGYGAADAPQKAKGFYEAWLKTNDELHDRFNKAGGDAPKIERYFPQPVEDARILARMGEQEWKGLIAPLLDREKMIDPMTDKVFSDKRLGEALSVVYRRKVTDGAIDLEPSRMVDGHGSLANQRQENRFLQFKDAQSWREYDAAVGNRGPYQAMMAHTNGLTKDVAALEVLGPNPNATVEWLKQVIEQESAKVMGGEPSLYAGKVSIGKGGAIDNARKIEELWTTINGAGMGNVVAADVMASVRNVLMADQLAGTFLTSLAGDPFQQRNARAFAGVSQLRWFADLPRQIFAGAEKRDVIRAGLVMQDAMEFLKRDLKVHGLAATSRELTEWLPDRVLTWTGLTPWTNVNRRAQASSFMFEAADRAGQPLSAIKADGVKGERFGRWLEGFGIGDAEWAAISRVAAHDQGDAGAMLRPMDLFKAGADDPALFELGLKYSQAVHGFMEEAVPLGSAQVRSKMGRHLPAGTLMGELARSLPMYLSYPVNVFTSLIRGTAHELTEGGMARGGSYAATAAVALTMGGALVVQLKELAKGNDPKPINTPEFWAEAFGKGGALGFYMDYILADQKRGAAETSGRAAGPVAALIGDVIALANPKALIAEDEVDRSSAAVRLGKKYTPLQNMWMIKPVTERLLWDKLAVMADPEAQRKWRQQERKLQKETGQGVWLGHGDVNPRRAPNFETLMER